ncbi:MAG: trigger factor, partial [Kiritimatiellae bacterium]|nr:trigger factor [Kiritimatiellia bacterium]
MNVEKTVKTACEIALKVSASAEEMAPVARASIQRIAQNASVPGFRKGKVPLAIVEKRFAGSIAEDTINRAIRTFNKDVLDKAGLDDAKVIGIRNVEDVNIADDKSLAYTLNLEVHPQVTLPKYKGIAVEKKPTTVTDEEVEERIGTFRKAFAKFEDAKEGDAIVEGDFVNFSIKGTVDGKGVLEVCPEAKAVADNDDAWTQIEEGRFVPEILEALKGMKSGEAKTGVKVAFGENAPEQLKGKEAVYDLSVKAFRRRILPTDEEFIKETHEESLDALKANMRKRLEDEAAKIALDDKRRQVVDAITAAAGEFDVPPSMVQRRVQERLDEMASNAQRSGLTAEYFQE